MVVIDSSNYIGIGYFLKSRREALGISKEEIAKSMVISVETLEKWENEDLDNMGLKEIRKMSYLLKYCPSIFIKGVPERAYIDWDNFIQEAYINY